MTTLGLQQLSSMTELSVQCSQKSFAVSTPEEGLIFFAQNKWLRIMDADKKPIIRTSNAWRWYPTHLEATVWDQPLLTPLYVRWSDQALLVGERDKQVLLKIQSPGAFAFHTTYEIWSTHTTGESIAEIGRMVLDDSAINITFPQELNIRCKAAVIASCLMITEAAMKRAPLMKQLRSQQYPIQLQDKAAPATNSP